MISKIFNIVDGLLLIWSTFKIMEIDRIARLPEHLNTNYHSNALPYFYVLLIGITAIIIVNAAELIRKIRDKVMVNKEITEIETVVETTEETVEKENADE